MPLVEILSFDKVTFTWKGNISPRHVILISDFARVSPIHDSVPQHSQLTFVRALVSHGYVMRGKVGSVHAFRHILPIAPLEIGRFLGPDFKPYKGPSPSSNVRHVLNVDKWDGFYSAIGRRQISWVSQIHTMLSSTQNSKKRDIFAIEGLKNVVFWFSDLFCPSSMFFKTSNKWFIPFRSK